MPSLCVYVCGQVFALIRERGTGIGLNYCIAPINLNQT